ncbi:hypothetical protein RSAG8_07902, partial [Rhizoctonia solani AG-8 WAC10335]
MRDLLKPLTDAERTGIEVVCADGWVRRVYPTLVASIADYPEQCKNACTKGSFCPICLVKPEDRGDLHQDIPLRERGPTLDAIIEHREEGSAVFEDFGLHDQWPWWNRHTFIDVATMHTPDLLHQCHKGVFKDHLAKWLPKIIGTKLFDSRYQAMPRHHGIRHFKKGASKLSRSTGREAKEMMKAMPRHHGIRHFKKGASKLSRSTGREAKEMMKVFLPVAADGGPRAELCEMDRQLKIFHENKSVFEEYKCLKKEFYHIPKFHALQHYTHSIRMLGTPDGYNTEAPERLHIDLTKAGFQASNKVDDTELEQMTEYIQRMDSLAVHRAYLTYKTHREGNVDESWDDYGDEEVADEMEGEASDEEEMEDLETASNNYLGSDGFEEEETEDEDDGNGDDLASGFIAERLVQTERGVTGESQGSTANQPEPMLYYPNPTVVTAATRKPPVTLQYLIATHSATNIGRDISLFLKKLHPTIPLITLPPNTELRIWTIARLFHAPLPFKPLDPPKVDHVRARPATIDNIQQIRRVEQYDTVLVLAYPNKTGIHRK